MFNFNSTFISKHHTFDLLTEENDVAVEDWAEDNALMNL